MLCELPLGGGVALSRPERFGAPLPIQQPDTLTFNPLPGSASSLQVVHISRGRVGTHCCQAVRTAAAFVQGHCTKKVVNVGAGFTLNVSAVTAPKLPPPPPRSAQNRSELVFASTVRAWPSAVTMSTDRSWSQVRP